MAIAILGGAVVATAEGGTGYGIGPISAMSSFLDGWIHNGIRLDWSQNEKAPTKTSLLTGANASGSLSGGGERSELILPVDVPKRIPHRV